jgi:hypothetical protein
LKVDIPAIPFARAWEAVIQGSGTNKKNSVTYRTIQLEYFEADKDGHGAGIRLISTDSYLYLRSWVAIDPDDTSGEPNAVRDPKETLLVIDADHRGLSLLQYAREQLKKTWAFKAKEEQPDVNPTVLLETRSAPREQQVLEGMDLQSLVIDFADHETVALPQLGAEFPSWRRLMPAVGSEAAVGFFRIGTDQLSKITKIGKLFDAATPLFTFHGEEQVAEVVIGGVRGLVKPALGVPEASEIEGDDDDQITLDELAESEEDDVDE